MASENSRNMTVTVADTYIRENYTHMSTPISTSISHPGFPDRCSVDGGEFYAYGIS